MALLRRRHQLPLLAVAVVLILIYSLRSNIPTDNLRSWSSAYLPFRSQPISSTAQAGTFSWSHVPVRYPIKEYKSLPNGRPKQLPPVQHKFEPENSEARHLREARRDEVKKAFVRCWEAYKAHAWMKDEVAPLSGGYKNTFGGWAATLVDSLDSLWIMGLKKEFEVAVAAAERIDFSQTTLDNVNVFETTIRYLGGFLAAYDLSGDKRLLAKAVEVGNMVYVAFDTPNHMPITRWDPRKAASGKAQVADDWVLVAEIGSLSMEFTRLSQITGDMKWFDATQRITELFAEQQQKTKLPGMWPVVVNARDNDLTKDTGFTLGGMSDSLYEYFPKMYALLGGLEPMYQRLYEGSMKTAIQHAFFRPMIADPVDILISGTVHVQRNGEVLLDPQGQHLTCFTGGMLGLGGKLFNDEAHLALANKLTDGCIWAYQSFPLGMMPELFNLLPCPKTGDCVWNETAWHTEVRQRAAGDAATPIANIIAAERLPKGFTAIRDRRYILRPEAIESVFLLYRMTGRKDLPDTAWKMFAAIQISTATHLANAALADMTLPTAPKMDSMESFWMAETLKYFYLIFSEDTLISLDEWVLNTEAHPFRRPS